MNELEKPSDKEKAPDWNEIRRFLETTIPHVEPLILRHLDNMAKEQDRQLEVAKMQHSTAKIQLIFEIAFIVLTIIFSSAIIWIFVHNGAPDTAEKILFAVLGFVGGRGFIKIGSH